MLRRTDLEERVDEVLRASDVGAVGEPPPTQLAFRPKEVIPTMTLESPKKTGPPESPKQVPPPVPGAFVWWRL